KMPRQASPDLNQLGWVRITIIFTEYLAPPPPVSPKIMHGCVAPCVAHPAHPLLCVSHGAWGSKKHRWLGVARGPHIRGRGEKCMTNTPDHLHGQIIWSGDASSSA